MPMSYDLEAAKPTGRPGRQEAAPTTDPGPDDALFVALTADLLVLQSLAKALRTDGAITEHTLDRVVAEALRRLLAADGPPLTAETLREVARLIDGLDRQIRERIRSI